MHPVGVIPEPLAYLRSQAEGLVMDGSCQSTCSRSSLNEDSADWLDAESQTRGLPGGGRRARRRGVRRAANEKFVG